MSRSAKKRRMPAVLAAAEPLAARARAASRRAVPAALVAQVERAAAEPAVPATAATTPVAPRRSAAWAAQPEPRLRGRGALSDPQQSFSTTLERRTPAERTALRVHRGS